MTRATQAPITLESRIKLRPLSRQIENDVAIIGHNDYFLELPLAGLDFLNWLEQGLSLAEARARFEQRHNPFPDDDLQAVMAAFLEGDFIAAIDDQPLGPHHKHPTQRHRLPQRWAQMLFSSPVLLAWIILVAPAAVLWVYTPALWPRRADFFWSEHYFLVVLVGILMWLLGMVAHELAHWLACRAKGIEATITWTQRLGFFPMSQTIMHNIWAVPRSARLLPLAAGMVLDIFLISLVLYLLYAGHAGWLVLPLIVTKLLKFYLLTSILALTAQFWLFSKMDGYFLLSSLLGQRNLQTDTYHWLKSRFRRTQTFEPPAGGMRFIYLYGLITVLWGGLFMGQFLLVDLPIKLQLLWTSLLKIGDNNALMSIEFADGVAVVTSQLIFWGLLLYAYWRDTLPNWRQNYS